MAHCPPIHRPRGDISIRRVGLVFSLALVAALTTVPAAGELAAQGWIEPDRPGMPAVERLRTSVDVHVVDGVAHVEVEEWFRNTGGGIAEGIYLYPLPGESVFQGYSLFQGDLELTGETMDAEQARRVYESIVRRRKDPALIELAGHGLIRASVFPIAAGETRRITLRYTQLLERAGDVLELRYAAGIEGRGDGDRIRPVGEGPWAPIPRTSGESPLDFTVTVDDSDRFLDPYSPTHPLEIERRDGRLVIRPVQQLSGGFSLFLPSAGEPVRIAVTSHRPSSEDGYFMLTLSPDAVGPSATPRDLTVVVDVSGSMSGEKIEQTRRAVLQLLQSLDPRDRFRLISFSNGVRSYQPGWTSAGTEELADARRWAESLQASGGTNISGALEEALGESSPAGRLPVVVFLTDGLPTVDETDPERIAERADGLAGRARVFAFGVGYDVNTYLLDRLTVSGGGRVEYVEPGEDVERALGVLAQTIRHPVLTDLVLEAIPGQASELYPTRLPDLFAGGNLTLFGRFGEADAGPVTLRGTRGGETVRYRAEVTFPDHSVEHDFIPRLWAARKIGELTRQVRLDGADPELVEEIRETALRYGLLSEYTSHLVLEPGMVAELPDGALPRHPAAGPLEEPASSGRDAVMRAEASSQARGVSSASDLAAFQQRAVEAAGASAEVHAAGRRDDFLVLGGRSFVRQDGTWVDRMHGEDTPTLRVRAFSPAWFDLLRALPELRIWWSSLSPVIVAGHRVSVAAGEDGVTELAPDELARVARDFRAPQDPRAPGDQETLGSPLRHMR